MALYNKFFHHQLLRKYTIAFASLFNNIYVTRYEDGFASKIHHEHVPISLSNKEKWYARKQQNDVLEKRIAVKLPRIAFQLLSVAYAPERKVSTNRKMHRATSDDPSKRSFSYVPLPYDINFTLAIAAKTQTEAMQIVEQIIPFFTPDYSISLRGVDDPSISYDVPISLLSINPDDSFEGLFDDRRVIVWDMDFIMKAYIFGPTRKGSIIKQSLIEMHTGLPGIDPNVHNETIKIEPFIDGIALSDIEKDDDYSILTTFIDETQ